MHSTKFVWPVVNRTKIIMLVFFVLLAKIFSYFFILTKDANHEETYLVSEKKVYLIFAKMYLVSLSIIIIVRVDFFFFFKMASLRLYFFK